MQAQALEYPDRHHLNAAEGWLELDKPAEARAELEQIDPAQQSHPDVLDLRWQVCARQERWNEALEIARELIHTAPGRAAGWLHHAYAVRRSPNGSIQQAWDTLLPAFEKFPTKPIVAYNLSCYACLLGRLDEARLWLRRAFSIGNRKQIKELALQDTDLQSLWDEIRAPDFFAAEKRAGRGPDGLGQ